MRKSVLTGLFACSLVLVASTASASAESLDSTATTNKNIQITSIVDLLAINKNEPISVNDTNIVIQADGVANELPPTQPEPVKHVVVEGESLSDIAKLHGIEWKRLYDKNASIQNPDVINVGMELIVPAAEEQLEPRDLPVPEPVVVPVRRAVQTQAPAPVPARAQASETKVASAPVSSPVDSSADNRYVAGYCTWYVKNMRPSLPNNLGNASTWVSRASAQGMATGSTPAAGAVGQRGNHVVYVQSVNGDGTVTISEMNHKGRYVITTRTLPADYFTYIY
jgi:surface antigen